MRNLNIISRLTGIGYLIIFISGFFANFFVLESFYIQDNPEQTLTNISQNIGLFEAGILSFVIMVLVDAILSWPLFVILKDVNKNLAATSSYLRLVNAIIFGIALFQLFSIHDATVNTANPEQIMQHYDTFQFIWNIGLVLFGMHLLLLGYLIYKSENITKVIGVLLIIAGVSYLLDSVAILALDNYNDYKDILGNMVIIGGILGEFSLTIRLLVKKLK